MTVKIAKFFSSSNVGGGGGGGVVGGGPPPLPPPNPTMKGSNKYYKQQQQQQQHHYNPYMMEQDEEEDNMSLYSTSASIMTTRDHPFNNSQRPLLADRKPQILSRKKHQIVPVTPPTNHHYQQQQQQQQQHYQQQQYISPYVQQQKRDSAKGLHGFNDFDILSQQYNQHLQSPHIGYPYGSPPSPTAASSDFVFEGVDGGVHSTPRYANVSAFASATPTPQHGGGGFMGKPSRFEDDFCSRRNVEFAKDESSNAVVAPPAAPSGSSSSSCSSVSSGPFVFGVPPEQQRDPVATSRMPAGGRGFGDCAEPSVISASSDGCPPFAILHGHTMMQSTSDTSSSSQDSRRNNKAAKLLLRRSSKAKKKKKAPVIVEKSTKDTPQADGAASTTTKQSSVKCVVVGDGAVGKTNLIRSYLENRFNPEHVPTASDIYNADVMVNDSPVHLTLCDTAGQDTLDPLRELCYPDSDVFLLCFSVARPETFHAIKTKWAPKFARTRAALILVGTQADLRTDASVLHRLQQSSGEKPISYADAWDLATTIGAKYIETSSATQDKVKEVFDTAIWEGLRPTELPPTPPLWKKLLCLA